MKTLSQTLSPAQVATLIESVGGEQNALALIEGRAVASVEMVEKEIVPIAVPADFYAHGMLNELELRGIRIDERMRELVASGELTIVEGDRMPQPCLQFCLGEFPGTDNPAGAFADCGLGLPTFGIALQYLLDKTHRTPVPMTAILSGNGKPKVLTCWDDGTDQWHLELVDVDDELIEMDEEYLVIMHDRVKYDMSLMN